jgi:hypothetical protein
VLTLTPACSATTWATFGVRFLVGFDSGASGDAPLFSGPFAALLLPFAFSALSAFARPSASSCRRFSSPEAASCVSEESQGSNLEKARR